MRKWSIPFWIASVAGAIIIVSQFGSLFALTDEDSAIAFLNTNAGLLATILAVTLSFMLLGLQFLAESYTPRALAGFMKDRVVYGFLILYITLIALSMVSTIFPSLLAPSQYVQYAIIGTLFSLVYLAAFVYHVVRRIQPENLIRHTLADVKDDEVLNQIIEHEGSMVVLLPAFKPFIILEQTLIKAISNDDIFSFVQGIEPLYVKLDAYLKKLYDKHKGNERSPYAKQSLHVHRFFARSFTQLEAECFSHNREQFITLHLVNLFYLMKHVHKRKNTWVLKQMWNELDYVGHKVFMLEMRSAAKTFLSEFTSYSLLEIENAKAYKSINHDPLHYAEIYSGTTSRIMLEEFQSEMLQSITRLGVISAERRIEALVKEIMMTFHLILPRIFSIADRVNRGSLLYYLLNGIEEVHKAAIKNGILRTGQSLFDLRHITIETGGTYKEDLKELTESFCKMSLYSLENKDYFEIESQRIAMLYLDEDFPELVLILLTTMRKSYSIVQDEPNVAERAKRSQQVIDAIRQIGKANAEKNKEIAEKAEQILREIEPQLG